jgi:hypothetical protein
MGRSRFAVLKIVAIGLLALGNGPCDCDDDDNPTAPNVQLVTIRGIVRDIDFGLPAAGVKVSLYADPTYADVVETGTDGRYSIQVPAGSPLVLYTDDFDPGADAWFPLINCDVPVLNVDQLPQADRDDWPIHACIHTVPGQPGSVASWDDYLANWDDPNNGDIFNAASSANSGGIIVTLNFGCDDATFAPHDSMSISTSSAAFPVAYWKLDHIMTFTGPDVFHPSSRTVTDGFPVSVSFGDSNATETSALLTFADMKAGRNLAWQPYTCPVRKGTISLVWSLSIDGTPNKHFREVGICSGLFSGPQLATRPFGRPSR